MHVLSMRHKPRSCRPARRGCIRRVEEPHTKPVRGFCVRNTATTVGRGAHRFDPSEPHYHERSD
eukprot:4944465-Pyramimonas_sp.AAC.1